MIGSFLAEVDGKTIEFEEQSDGWFVNLVHQLAIDPEMTVCVTDPWYADHICEPPTHPFEIISRS